MISSNLHLTKSLKRVNLTSLGLSLIPKTIHLTRANLKVFNSLTKNTHRGKVLRLTPTQLGYLMIVRKSIQVRSMLSLDLFRDSRSMPFQIQLSPPIYIKEVTHMIMTLVKILMSQSLRKINSKVTNNKIKVDMSFQNLIKLMKMMT